MYEITRETLEAAGRHADNQIAKSIEDARERLIAGIAAQREEILVAFVAKYGFHPDEAEQVIVADGRVTRWFVRKRVMQRAEQVDGRSQ